MSNVENVKILDNYLSPLGFKVGSYKDYMLNSMFNIIDRNGSITICIYDNGSINMYWSSTKKILLDLCTSIVKFTSYFGNNMISNPYYGCKSIYEMDIKKDLVVA